MNRFKTVYYLARCKWTRVIFVICTVSYNTGIYIIFLRQYLKYNINELNYNNNNYLQQCYCKYLKCHSNISAILKSNLLYRRATVAKHSNLKNNSALQRLPVTRPSTIFFPISKTKFWWTSIKCIHDNSQYENKARAVSDPPKRKSKKRKMSSS